MNTIARAIGAEDASLGLYDFTGRLGAKRSLREFGMPESGIEKAAVLATQNPYWNPRKLELESIRELLRRAWGRRNPECIAAEASLYQVRPKYALTARLPCSALPSPIEAHRCQ